MLIRIATYGYDIDFDQVEEKHGRIFLYTEDVCIEMFPHVLEYKLISNGSLTVSGEFETQKAANDFILALPAPARKEYSVEETEIGKFEVTAIVDQYATYTYVVCDKMVKLEALKDCFEVTTDTYCFRPHTYRVDTKTSREHTRLMAFCARLEIQVPLQ